MSSVNDTIKSIIKKLAFRQSTKAIKKKFKIKSEFSFNQMSMCKLSIKDGIFPRYSEMCKF